jgi:hypothetical protein
MATTRTVTMKRRAMALPGKIKAYIKDFKNNNSHNDKN